jgi:uncharacterized membrane protein (UPF0127 family)
MYENAKKTLLSIFGVMIFIVAMCFLAKRSNEIRITRPSNYLEGEFQEFVVDNTSVMAVIADTGNKRKNGLSGVTEMGEDQGLFFVFNDRGVEPEFWMKDMLIPIDILWIEGETVVKIDHNVQPPAPDTPDRELTIYEPGQPIDFVLEVNGGFSDAKGIVTGSTIDYSNVKWAVTPPFLEEQSN